MRCCLGEKKLRKYQRLLKLNEKLIIGYVRGNTNHRVDLKSESGRYFALCGNLVEELDPAKGFFGDVIREWEIKEND